MLTNIINKFKVADQKGRKHKPEPEPDTGHASENEADRVKVPVLPEWRPGDILLDRYRVDKVFGGAMGKVYIAEHLGWKIPVAIKSPRAEVLADHEGAKRVLSEADNWVRMGMHPNVATCFYVLKISDIPYLFIEYVDGGDLSTWIKTGRCRDLRTALSLAVQFCHGMEFTHSKGIIHRDIKPQNILLTQNALLKITDFGIIQTTKSLPSPSKGSLSGKGKREDTIGFRGTPAYASPEQLKDSHAIDRRTDIFSFGVCLWLMLCGKKPYANNAIEEDPQPVSLTTNTKFPDILVKLLKKTVAFNPDQRYQDFAELRHDLNQAYIELFKIPCPYMQINFIDLQAENFNNRAVSCLELGRIKEGSILLNKALDSNDTLPEALYNFTLLRWKSGKMKPECILRQLEAAKQRLPKSTILDSLTQAVKCEILGRVWKAGDMEEEEDKQVQEREQFYPEYMLCLPRNSLEVFRAGQAHQAVQNNLKYLLKLKRYEACYEVLLKAWEGLGFRKDKVFIEIYEKLARISDKGEIKGVIRLATLPSEGATAKSLTYLSRPKKFLSLSKSGRVALRSYGARKKISALGKFQGIKLTALSQDGSLLALGGPDSGVSVIEIASGEQLKTFKTKDRVTALAFSADNRYLSMGTDKGVIQTCHLSKGSEKVTKAEEAGAVRSIIYFNKDLDFVTGSENGTLRFWSAGGNECVRIVEAHAMPITSLFPASNGLFFISSSADRVIKIWDRQTGQCLKSIAAHDDLIRSAIILPDNKYIVSGSDDDIIKIWQISSGTCLHILDGRGDGIRSLAIGPKPYIFLAGRNDGQIVIWIVVYELAFD